MDVTWTLVIFSGIAGGLIGCLPALRELRQLRAVEQARLTWDQEQARERAERRKVREDEEREQERADAERRREREADEAWRLARRYSAVGLHMSEPTIGELKRAIALPECQYIRDNLLAKGTLADSATYDPLSKVQFEAHLDDYRRLKADDPLPRDTSYSSGWEGIAFGAWLEELAAQADAELRAQRVAHLDATLPPATPPASKRRF